MIETRRPLRVGRLQFHEGAFADLDIDQRGLSRLVEVPESLRKSHDLRVIRHSLVEVRHADGHMIQSDDSTVRPLSQTRLDRQANRNPCDKTEKNRA